MVSMEVKLNKSEYDEYQTLRTNFKKNVEDRAEELYGDNKFNIKLTMFLSGLGVGFIITYIIMDLINSGVIQ